MFFSLRSVCLALFFLFAAVVSIHGRSVNLELEGIPMGEYRLEPYGDYGLPQKRVPSAGDMMVRFGKRAA